MATGVGNNTKATTVTTVDSDYVTLEEAEARLAQVRPLLENARSTKREIESLAAGFDYDSVLIETEKERFQPLVTALSQILDQLEDQGCYIKDLDIGLVDFLSTFEGRDIFLCWKLGEPHISHWHEVNEGFSSRQEILDMTDLEFDIAFETPVVENEN
jgi:hypothetical protein